MWQRELNKDARNSLVDCICSGRKPALSRTVVAGLEAADSYWLLNLAVQMSGLRVRVILVIADTRHISIQKM
jgi:hypothetical protein